jgi:hypothetical protein
MYSVKSAQLIATEAIILGIMLYSIHYVFSLLQLGKGFTVFASAVALHVACEYSGLNQWYSLKYVKMIS